jgi:hypothetical protein
MIPGSNGVLTNENATVVVTLSRERREIRF